MRLSLPLLITLALALPAAPLAAQGPVRVALDSKPSAGTLWCFTVYAPPAPGGVSVSVDIGGTDVAVTSVRAAGEGRYYVCVDVPDWAAGQVAKVTAVCGALVGSNTVPVQR